MKVFTVGILWAIAMSAWALPQLQRPTPEETQRFEATHNAILAIEHADKLESCLSVEPLDKQFIRKCMEEAYTSCAWLGEGPCLRSGETIKMIVIEQPAR